MAMPDRNARLSVVRKDEAVLFAHQKVLDLIISRTKELVAEGAVTPESIDQQISVALGLLAGLFDSPASGRDQAETAALAQLKAIIEIDQTNEPELKTAWTLFQSILAQFLGAADAPLREKISGQLVLAFRKILRPSVAAFKLREHYEEHKEASRTFTLNTMQLFEKVRELLNALLQGIVTSTQVEALLAQVSEGLPKTIAVTVSDYNLDVKLKQHFGNAVSVALVKPKDSSLGHEAVMVLDLVTTQYSTMGVSGVQTLVQSDHIPAEALTQIDSQTELMVLSDLFLKAVYELQKVR